jgi:glycine cleavage system H protein
MAPLIDFIGTFGIFVAGLAVRLLAFLVILAVLSTPLLLVLGGVEGVARLRRRLLGVAKVGLMSFRPGLHYAPGHTWVETGRGRFLRVGLDDLAQRLIPAPLRISLPQVGARVHQGDPAGVIRADGQETWFASPVSGTVTAVNPAITRDPSLLHRDPYVRGWLFQVAPADVGFRDLPREEPARRWFVNETVRLQRVLERELGYAAADGGELLSPAPSLLQRGEWRRVADSFLHA